MKDNHVHLKFDVKTLRDDSCVEDLFLSAECQHRGEAAAEPTTEFHFHSSSCKTKGWRSLYIQRWRR